MNNYNNACTEVSTILEFLDKEEYKKISKDVIEAIERNKNTEYVFNFDINIPLQEQNLLKETKAILFNLFRDYLATSKQRDIIIKIQKEERYKLNKIKKEKYDVNIFNKQKKYKDNIIKPNTEVKDIVNIKKDNLFDKILKRIQNFWKRTSKKG